MNKAISETDVERIKRCIVDMNNKANCYKATSIHHTTIDKIVERGYAKDSHIKKLLAFCDKVEANLKTGK